MSYTPSPTSELDAVNQMLSAISEAPVNTLDESTLTDSDAALSLLRRESRALQTQGWYFNTDEGVSLIPDSVTKQIILPVNTLSITFQGVDKAGPYTYRAGKVYDRRNQTYQIDHTLTADIVLLLAFEEMPEPARNFVTIRACRRLQDARLGDGALHQFQERDEVVAWAAFLERDAEDADYNINRDSPSVYNVTDRYGGSIL